MKKKLIIFGATDVAQLAHYYFNTDSDYEVVVFTADARYIEKPEFCGLPLVPFENITNKYPPNEFSMFIAIGYTKINSVRKDKYLVAKELGYELPGYISSHATVLNQGQFGENCFILEDSTVQPFVKIGNNVTLWSGCHIAHHSVINDHTFIASHAMIAGGVEIGEQCFIGVNATLRNHIKVGDRCVIGAGVLLLSDANPEGVYIGSATERSEIVSTKLRSI